MTKQDDANLNINNPLNMRAAVNGGTADFYFEHMDENVLNLIREAGIWTDRNYLKGERVWFDGVAYISLTDITQGAADPWLDDGNNWRVVAPITGYGEMDLAAPVAGADITAAWQTLSAFDTIPYTPLGMTFDLPTSTFDIDYRGLWDLNLTVFVTFDDSNQGRTMQVRLFNVTEASAGDGITLAIPRNAGGVNLSVPFPIVADALTVTDTYRIEVGNVQRVGGGSDTITGVNYEWCRLAGRQVAAVRPNVTGTA